MDTLPAVSEVKAVDKSLGCNYYSCPRGGTYFRVTMDGKGMEIGLVSCTKAKADSASTPRELYEPSPLFRKARSYAEENHDEWYVLSAKYSVLDPDGSPIEPYDKTLNNASVEERQKWSQKVLEQLRERDLLAEGNTLVFHAGKSYYEELLPLLDDKPIDVKIPTEGLRMGETLSWYNERI